MLSSQRDKLLANLLELAFPSLFEYEAKELHGKSSGAIREKALGELDFFVSRAIGADETHTELLVIGDKPGNGVEVGFDGINLAILYRLVVEGGGVSFCDLEILYPGTSTVLINS